MTWPLVNPVIPPERPERDKLGKAILVAFVIVILLLFFLAFADAAIRDRNRSPNYDLRPVVYCYTSRSCSPCQQLHRDVENGKLSQFRFEFSNNRPGWVNEVPTLHYLAGDGQHWKRYLGWGPGAVEDFTRRYEFWQSPKLEN
jgi:hypothetical protein